MARTFHNSGTTTVRIECELLVPPGRTSLPIELGGLVVTPRGELQIEQARAAGMQVRDTPSLVDTVACPSPPAGTRRGAKAAVVDGGAAVGHTLRLTAAPTQVSAGGTTVDAFTAANETTGGSTTVFGMQAPFGVGDRLTVVALGGTHVEGATTYRMIAVGVRGAGEAAAVGGG